MLAQILIPVVVILLILVALNSPIWVAIFGATLYLQIFVNHMNLTNLFTGIFEACTKNLTAGGSILYSCRKHHCIQLTRNKAD